MFIGREAELTFFEEKFREEKGQLLVLYGRRRVGKTETLRKFCEGKDHIFYSCIDCPDIQQIELISGKILHKNNPASRYIDKFHDWKQIFENLAELSLQKKQLVVIDEFPYMVLHNPAIPSILQNIWDSVLKDRNICLILCGSAMSFIEKEILAEKNPLYGRATGILKMNEMDFYDAIKFFPGFTPEDKVAAYSVLGGIPHYLKQFDDKKTLKENIVSRILQKGSILYSEVEFLLRQELRETSVYNVIIQAVAMGNTKLNDIHLKTQIEKSKISVYLKNLMDLGIVYREFPVDAGIKETANINRGLYRLSDHYFTFWYRFVFPNQSELETGDFEGIWKYAVEPELNEFVSFAFEKICMQYLRKENRQNKLPFHFIQIGRWWDKKNEIDIMAVDKKRENFLLGECKYKNTKISAGDFWHLKGKFSQERGQFSYVMFSKSGFTEDVLKLAEEESIRMVGIEELTDMS